MRFPLCVAFLVFACTFVNAQAQPPRQKVEIKRTDSKNLPNGYQEPRVVQIDPANFKKDSRTQDTVRVIIKLQSVLSKSTGRSKGSDVDSQHRLFLSDLNKLTGAGANQRTGAVAANQSSSEAQTVIHHEYRKTFNGFALTTSGRIAESLKSLPYVAAVVEDKQVKVTSDETNTVINAQQVWQEFGATGKNIRIGIIDTGIDYTHPDLGQGFGAGFKVVDGYDFVNNDADPMDDHGHGTHVSGIAAANGATYKGVAPDATLVGYKVLSSDGWGYNSWIIAAVERTVDPDQNPATDDALDVVNMSLGGTPVADDPMSEAVNNAVAKGVVFCVAAGNSGGYLTIGSPGIAANAITVGATDNNLNTADFSSKGPTEDFRLKPEVAAPGVNVTSAYLQHGYTAMSGTSMATPHVTGAVALILEKKPDLTPAMVKDLLMTTAQTPATSSPWDQGAGVIDVYKALNTSTSFTISSGFLNFELADATSSVNKTRTFSIKNNSTNAQSFNLTGEGELSTSPFSLTISPSQLTLQPGAEQLITVTLSSSAAVAMQNFPDAYTGRVNVSDGQSTLRIESVLINPQHTDINFEGELPNQFYVVGIEGSYYFGAYYPSAGATSMRLYLPNAKYDIITQYDYAQRILITEGIETDENVNVTLRKADVKNRIDFRPLDENGDAFDVGNSVFGSAIFTGNNRNFLTAFLGFVGTLYVSDTEHYGIEFGFNNPVDGKYYDISAGTSWGISSSGTYSNDPNAFNKVTFQNPFLTQGESQMTAFNNYGSPYVYFTSWNSYPFEFPATFDLYQTRRASASGYLGMFFSFTPPPGKSGYTCETYTIRSEEGDQTSFYQFSLRKRLTLDKKQFVYPLGKTIPVFDMTPIHNDTRIGYATAFGRGAFVHAFGEHESGATSYHLYQNGVTLKKGWILQSIYTKSESYFPEALAAPGSYNLDFEYRDFQTGGKFGIAKLSTMFNTGNSDPNPPYLTSLRLVSNGEDTNELHTSTGAKLRLTLRDGCDECETYFIQTPTVRIKKQDAANWSDLTIESQGNAAYTADLPTLEPGYYVLQIKGADAAGNSFIYEVTPAFYIGEEPDRTPFTTVNLIAPRNFSQNVGTTPLFQWTAVAADSYTLQISDDLSFENPIELTSDQNTLLLESPLVENTDYYWRVKANGSNTSGAWSSIFRFTAKFRPIVQLISPVDSEEVDYGEVPFEWSPAKGAWPYLLEVSRDENFSQLYSSYYTAGTSVTLFFYPNGHYYWRVKAFFSIGWSDEETISNVRTFDVKKIPPPLLILPADNATEVPLSAVNFSWSHDPYNEGYVFELSKNEAFTNVVESTTVYTNSITISGLLSGTDYFWRVKGIGQYTSAEWSSTFRFKSKVLPPVLLVSPDDGAEVDYGSVSFEWSSSPGASSYQLEISSREDFSELYFTKRTTDTEVSVYMLPTSHYYWRVKAIFTADSFEDESISSFRAFNTRSILSPTLNSPANNSADVQLAANFSWSGVDANTGYLFELSKNESFTNIAQSLTVNTSSIAVKLEPGIDYYWRVRGNAGSVSGPWSSIFHLKSKIRPVVQLTSPANDVEIGYGPTSFKWALLPGATDYRLEISPNENFSELYFTNRTSGTEAPAPLLPTRKYYWRVKAFFVDGSIEEETVSSVRSFRTKSILPPELLFPANHSTDMEWETNFSWSGDAANTGYLFQLSKGESFTDLVQSAAVNTSSIAVSALEPKADYYWRVKATYDNTSGPWSSVFHFKSKLPPKAALASPDNGAEIGFSEASFKWLSAAGASAYQIEISTNENFSDLYFINRSGDTGIYTSLFPGRNYYWRVKAIFVIGGFEGETVSNVRAFSTKSFLAPTLLFPANRSANVELETNFLWSGEGAGVGYLFELSKNDNFTNLVHSATVSTSSIAVNKLEPEAAYFWRVTAFFKTKGFEKEAVSSIGTFSTKKIPRPTLLSPTNHSTDVQLATNFSWSGEATNTSYLFELSKNEVFSSVVQSLSVSTNSLTINGLEQKTKYFWRVTGRRENEGFQSTSEVFRFGTIDAVTSLDPVGPTLNYSVPNPFSTSVEIVIQNAISEDVLVTIVDPVGRVIKQLPVQLKPGTNRVAWSGRDDNGGSLASGVYFAFIPRSGQAPNVIRMMRIDN